MFKLGFAILFVVFFPCDCFENLQAEEPEKGEDVVSDDEAGARETSQRDDDGVTEDDGAIEGEDETQTDVYALNKEGNSQESRQRRHIIDRCDVRSDDPGWPACCRELWRRNRNAAYKACCGSQIYDYRYYKCCGGSRYRKRRGSSFACCGKNAYDWKHQMCCGGSVQRKPLGRPACCGKNAYDWKNQMCCGGSVQRKPLGRPACCGTRSYDKRECLCCEGKVRRRSSHICCRNTLQPRPSRWSSQCCGKRAYDRRRYICCNRKIQQQPSVDAQCCGTQAYDYKKYECRGGRIVARPPSSSIDWQ